MNLDDLQLPKNHVLTGLSFITKISHGNHKRLHLQIFSMPIDFESGKLLLDYKLNLTSNSSKLVYEIHFMILVFAIDIGAYYIHRFL